MNDSSNASKISITKNSPIHLFFFRHPAILARIWWPTIWPQLALEYSWKKLTARKTTSGGLGLTPWKTTPFLKLHIAQAITAKRAPSVYLIGTSIISEIHWEQSWQFIASALQPKGESNHICVTLGQNLRQWLKNSFFLTTDHASHLHIYVLRIWFQSL